MASKPLKTESKSLQNRQVNNTHYKIEVASSWKSETQEASCHKLRNLVRKAIIKEWNFAHWDLLFVQLNFWISISTSRLVSLKTKTFLPFLTLLYDLRDFPSCLFPSSTVFLVTRSLSRHKRTDLLKVHCMKESASYLYHEFKPNNNRKTLT